MIRLGVLGLTAPAQAQPVPKGAILGHMNVELGPLLVTGCALARLTSGELQVWFPKFSRECRVVLRGQAERDRLVQLAANAYRALTGRDPAETPVAKASPKTDHLHDPA